MRRAFALLPSSDAGVGRGRLRPLAGAALAFACLSWPLRSLLESGMATHMLVQFPALMLAGALLSEPFAARAGSRWNRLGIAGLAFAAGVLAVSMIPRLLDLAQVDASVEAVKAAALIAAGAALRRSWARAGLVVQGFFLGNVLPMTAVVGTLYRDAPVRLCNAYRLDEQALVGTLLVVVAVVVAVTWLVVAGMRMHRAEIALRSPFEQARGCAAPAVRRPLHEERPWPEDVSTTTSRRPSATRHSSA
ncbi:MAG TPA: hypothetical protein VK047_05565 [Zeimonas sp.]|nr:hypothetical protein [Zeimonas sp.]